MMNWALILCEGRHDQLALESLAVTHARWVLRTEHINALPTVVRQTFPNPPTLNNRGTGYDIASIPSYLEKDNRWVVLHALGGVDNVLGRNARLLLGNLDELPDAVGIVVDADTTEIEDRVRAFQNNLKSLFPHATEGVAGQVWGSSPKLGLWVAPDNFTAGEMTDILVAAAKLAKPKLIGRGQRFVRCLAKLEPGSRPRSPAKAVLGAVHQSSKPGASLAVGLQHSKCWLDILDRLPKPLADLLGFVDQLTAPDRT